MPTTFLIWSVALISHGLGLVLNSVVLRSRLPLCFGDRWSHSTLLPPPLKDGQAFSLQLDG
jgi:hypothetical protein